MHFFFFLQDLSTTGWLQKDALEQLSEVASHLYKLLIGAVQLMKGNVTLVNLILQILISTLKFSQKRRIYQPHFTISVEGLFKIYQVVVDVSSVPRSSLASEFGLKVILMSPPPLTIFQMVFSLSLSLSVSLSSQCMCLCVADVWASAKCNLEKLLFAIIFTCE